jgi:tetratricopeptide (TPR) repeat protein
MSEDWRALGAEAARFLGEGRWAEAAQALEQVVELNPGHADSWYNLGYARRHARHYAGALAAYAKALELGVRGAEEAHLNQAVILSEHLHDTGEAQAELEKAIAIKPDFTAAWLNLGNLHEDLGDLAGARQAYESALRADPVSGRARARLGSILAHQGVPSDAIAYLEASAAAVRPGSEDAAEVCFALGNVLDAAGDYPRAFAAIAQGNALAASLREPSRRYDRAAQEALVDSLIATFAQAAPATDSDPPPVAFICGMFRSGSTLIEQMLARHSGVTAGGELEFIPAMVAEDLQPYPQSLIGADGNRLTALRSKYLVQLRSLFPGAGLVTDKRPDNFLHIGLIKALFPTARIVHTVRNPLDNILSAYFLYFSDNVAYSERLDDIAHYYAQYRRLMAHWQRLYGDDIFAVDYDRLVADPRSVMVPLLDFLGLGWEEECLDQRQGGPVRTASVWQVRRPLHSQSSGRWRNYESELAPVRHQLADLSLLGDAD